MKFWIVFNGYCPIEAETEEEAKEKFWEDIYSRLNSNDYQITEIEYIEKD